MTDRPGGGEELREAVEKFTELLIEHDHKRLCQGREYECSCGYDSTIQEAAKQLRALTKATDTESGR